MKLLHHLLKYLPIALLLASLSLLPAACSRIPLCKYPGCKVRMVHSHAGASYRGQPWWRKNQNPRIGQKYFGLKDTKVPPKNPPWWMIWAKRPKKKAQEKDPDILEGIKARDPKDRKKDKHEVEDDNDLEKD
jgi:hypothetical protein